MSSLHTRLMSLTKTYVFPTISSGHCIITPMMVTNDENLPSMNLSTCEEVKMVVFSLNGVKARRLGGFGGVSSKLFGTL